MSVSFFPTAIPEVVGIEIGVFRDHRGFFMEAFREGLLEPAGIQASFVQDNHSGSRRNVLRGLHYQVGRPQGKLVRAVTGEIFDVAVDLRRHSTTFGRWTGEVLSAGNRRMLWIPPGFAHGFLALSDWADVIYKTTDYHYPAGERTLLWNDPTVAVRWPISESDAPILSAKDASGTILDLAEVYE